MRICFVASTVNSLHICLSFLFPDFFGILLVFWRLHLFYYRRYIQSCCATTGDGLYEGLDWLSNTLSAKSK
jgi:hypothetical protein